MRLAAILALAAAVPLLQTRVDSRLGRFRAQEEVLYLWSGEHVQRLAAGFEDLLADVYWLRTVQYFGGQRLFSDTKRFELLYPLVEITTTLDPRFELAYRYGAVFLCEPHPIGKGDCEAGIRILERGVRAIPDSWRLRQDLGCFKYLFMGDAQGGAKVLIEAAELPGAPFWLASLGGAILARAGDRQTSRMVWQRLLDQGEGRMKENARHNLKRLDGLDAIDALDRFVARRIERAGRAPSYGELTGLGVDRRYLADPTGVPFDYDAEAGRFWFARESRLWMSRTQ